MTVLSPVIQKGWGSGVKGRRLFRRKKGFTSPYYCSTKVHSSPGSTSDKGCEKRIEVDRTSAEGRPPTVVGGTSFADTTTQSPTTTVDGSPWSLSRPSPLLGVSHGLPPFPSFLPTERTTRVCHGRGSVPGLNGHRTPGSFVVCPSPSVNVGGKGNEGESPKVGFHVSADHPPSS